MPLRGERAGLVEIAGFLQEPICKWRGVDAEHVASRRIRLASGGVLLPLFSAPMYLTMIGLGMNPRLQYRALAVN